MLGRARNSRPIVKEWQSPDGLNRVAICDRGDGFFLLNHEVLVSEDFSSFGRGIEKYWAGTLPHSGLYASIEDAERDARLRFPWLSET